MRVGWLGVGAMGAPMATRAARSGHSVRAYDITPERAAALAADGVQPAENDRRGRRGRRCDHGRDPSQPPRPVSDGSRPATPPDGNGSRPG